MTIAIFLFSLLGAMALGMPIAFALLVCAVAMMYQLNMMDAQIIAQNLIAGADSFPLMAAPFFLLAGEVMNSGGLSKRIVNVALTLVGHVSGGLGYVVILASCILAALSGSAVADAAALSALLFPMMVKAGHNPAKSAGLIAAGGIIGPIIPPSIGFIVFGVAAGLSISKLFLAGIVPGILIGAGLAIAWWWEARKENIVPPPKATRREVVRALVEGGVGAGPAGHHHLRPQVRHLHADRGRRRLRGVRAVRRDLHLQGAQVEGRLRRLRDRRRDDGHRDVPGGRGAGLGVAHHGRRAAGTGHRAAASRSWAAR